MKTKMPLNEFIKQLMPATPDIQLPSLDQVKDWEMEQARIIPCIGGVNDEEGGFDTVDVCSAIIRYNELDKDIPVEERKPIILLIDSNGGDAFGTYVLIKTMKLSKTKIKTVNMCSAMSAAGYILMAGHERLALPGSLALVHDGSYGVSGDRAKADSAKKMGDRLDEKILEFVLENTKITKKDYHKYAPQDWYIFDDEQIKYGVVDKIITSIDEILA